MLQTFICHKRKQSRRNRRKKIGDIPKINNKIENVNLIISVLKHLKCE